MLEVILYICAIFVSLSVGIIVAYGFISLISSVGLLRNIIRTFNTKKYSNFYIGFLILGVLLGSVTSYYFDFTLLLGDIGKVIAGVVGLFYGIFVGYLALGLAEVFDIIPVVNNKLGFRYNIRRLVLICALGKTLGSLTYFLVPGFYSYK